MATSYLIDERPLLVLPSLAKKVGINHAILLQQMHYWLRSSSHQRDGHAWIYNTYSDWQAQLPWLSESGIRKVVADLVDREYIFVANHNRKKFDQTKWYRINYELLQGDFADVTQSDTSNRTKGHIIRQKVSDDVTQSVSSDVTQSDRPIPESTETTDKESSFDPSLTLIEGGITTPRKPMPRHGMAQTLLATLHEDVLKIGPPTKYGFAVKQAQKLADAGCTPMELRQIAEWLLADPFWAGKGVTINRILDKRDDFHAAKIAESKKGKKADASGGLVYG